MFIRFSSAVTVLAACVYALVARGEVFQLKNGGEIVGERVEGGDENEYIIRSVDGAEITLDRNELERVVQQDDSLAEYVRRSRSAPDTAEAHRELAAWCRQHKLAAQADHHLARVAELDPEDEASRRSLGLQLVGNRWLTRDELMAERGMTLYDNKYRTRQDIAIRDRDKQGESLDVDWLEKLRMWRGWLENRREDRVAEAQAQIVAITDPAAVPALVRLLADEEDEWIFKLLLTTLGGLDHPQAVQTLVAYSLEDDDPEIRRLCLDFLTSGPRVVSIVPYVQALKGKDNAIVNRAGEALGKIGDPAAVSPLIDALVTTHKYEVEGGPGISAGFSPSGAGGGGLSMGGNGPKIVKMDKENPRVRYALEKLTGMLEFDFDEQAWRSWYVDQQMRERFNSRRDE